MKTTILVWCLESLRNNLKVKYAPGTIAIIALASMFGQTVMVPAPVYAFWFFHHKHKDKQTAAQPNSPNYYPTNFNYYPASPYTAGQVHYLGPDKQFNNKHSHRLIPSYLMNSSASANNYTNQIDKKSKLDGTTANKQGVTVQQNLYNPISNTIPANINAISPATTIRIGIGLNLQAAKLAVLDGAQLIDNTSGELLANLPAQSEWLLSVKDDHLVLQPAKEYYLSMQKLAKFYKFKPAIEAAVYTTTGSLPNTTRDLDMAPLSDAFANTANLPLSANKLSYTIKPANTGGLLAFNDRLYRGSFLIKQTVPINKNPKVASFTNDISADKTSAAFNIINCLDIEDYLLSVVPSEMPSLWPSEALKAQTIAARSYAIANFGKHGSLGYDLKDNTEDQVYLGVRSESQPTNEAVNATKGLVIKYDGKPICAYFHSSSGGSTEAAEHVWHKPVPYLKAVTDFDQEAPLYNWTKNYSILQTESGLPKDIGQVLSISVLAKSPSGRTTYMLVNGLNSSHIISGEAARKYFSLPSANFNVTPAETAYIFTGKGFGHGLGLSQWGAKSLAKHGYNAAQILCYYYTGISIDY